MKRLLLAASAVALLAPAASAQDDDSRNVQIVNPRTDDTEDVRDRGVDDLSDVEDLRDAEGVPDSKALEDIDAEAILAEKDRELNSRYTEDHPWVDTPVFAEGELIGEIARVHLLRDEIDTVVIGVGGADPEEGGGEVEVTAEDVERVTRPNGQTVFELELAMADFKALPGYVGASAAPSEASEDAAEGEEPADETN